jgi:hypothetical protein
MLEIYDTFIFLARIWHLHVIVISINQWQSQFTSPVPASNCASPVTLHTTHMQVTFKQFTIIPNLWHYSNKLETKTACVFVFCVINKD